MLTLVGVISNSCISLYGLSRPKTQLPSVKKKFTDLIFFMFLIDYNIINDRITFASCPLCFKSLVIFQTFRTSTNCVKYPTVILKLNSHFHTITSVSKLEDLKMTK